ncbi:8982_t:CDS:2 [Paraglomus occultum]|uniref:8982_t:CDS:1 n=1 Tax=Paraglomus occultum TaxID=144539 RepID=A0A9N9B4U5_9GLOM|nr:8982_t:CDS:2 [Paraglomus occultum]
MKAKFKKRDNRPPNGDREHGRREASKNTVSMKPKLVSESDDFEALDEDILLMPNALDDKPGEWSEADFNALGNTLSNLLPATPTVFSDVLFSPERKYLDPFKEPASTEFNAAEASLLGTATLFRLITKQHASLVTSWIEDDSATTYKLCLLYRAPDMGFRLPIKDWLLPT